MKISLTTNAGSFLDSRDKSELGIEPDQHKVVGRSCGVDKSAEEFVH